MKRFSCCFSLLRRFREYGLAVFLLLLSSGQLSAVDLVAQGGLGVATQSPMLLGYAVSLNLRGNSQKGAWFSDTQLIYHDLRSVSDAKQGNASSSITFQSYELNWFVLFPVKTGSGSLFYWGPGVGYGIAEVKEEITYEGSGVEEDPSPFFTAYDIHYGTVALKLGFSWNNKTCEGRLSSFGGLIGGTILCGIFF